MQNFLRDLRHSARSLLRDRGYTATVLLTLAICIAANGAIFAIVNSVLLRPLPGPNSDRLVLMSNRYPKAGVGTTYNSGVPDYYDRIEAVTALEQQALFQPSDRTLEIGSTPEQVKAMAVTPTLFPLLGVPAAVGRTFDAAEGELGSERKVILSRALCRQLYGADQTVVGRELRLNGRAHTIVGVMPADFVFVDPDVRLWIPLAFDLEAKAARHSNSWSHIGLLKPGASIEQVQSQVDALNAANLDRFPRFKEVLINAGFHTKVEPLAKMITGEVASTLYLLWGGALLVLLIGGLNIANLMLVRASTRRREIATRLALGATRGDLTRQSVAENSLLALVGGILGVLACSVLLRSLTRFGLDRFPRAAEVRVEPAVVAVSLLLALIVVLIFGLLPLVQTLKVSLMSVLREGSRGSAGGRRARRVRQVLVASEVAFAFALLAGAGLLLASFRKLLDVDPGFTSKGVWTASTVAPSARYKGDAELRALMNRLLEGIRHSPGVVAAGATTSIPLGTNRSDSVILAEGYQMKQGESLISPHKMSVTPGFFEAMGIRLIRGRYFDQHDDESAPRAIVIDEKLANKFWPNRDPLGQRMFNPGDTGNLTQPDEKTQWYRVVGVVRSVRIDDLADRGNTVGAYYFPWAQAPRQSFTLTVKTNGDPAAMGPLVRAQVTAADRELALFDIKTMDERGALSLSSRRTSVLLAVSFGALALFLAGIGIHGVLSYLVAQRTREIGIRMALGSTRSGVAGLVLLEGLTIVAAGLVLGLGLALAMQGVIRQEIYGVTPLDPLVYASVMGLLVALAAIACAAPAHRAATVDPATVLEEY
jgi:predicted permease